MNTVKTVLLALLAVGTFSSAAAQDQGYSFDALDMYFYKAYSAYLSGQDEKAADALEDAADLLGDYGKDADDSMKDWYKDQKDALNDLADAIERGDIDDDGQLRYAFVKTHHGLGGMYNTQARTYYDAGDTKNTGNALTYSAGHLGYATLWSGNRDWSDSDRMSVTEQKNGNRMVAASERVLETGANAVKGTGKAAYKGGKAVTKTAYKGAKGVAKGTYRGKLFGGDKVDDDEMKETMDYMNEDMDRMNKDLERNEKSATDVDGVHPSVYKVGTNY